MSAKDPVRAYLNSVLECRMEAARSRRKFEMLEARATSITAQLSGMPFGGGSDREALLAALADASGDYYRQMVAAEQRELEVSKFIDSLPDSSHRVILKLRYVDCKRWSKVLKAYRDNGVEMSERQMFLLHGAALKAAREKYKEKTNDEIRDSCSGEPDRDR